MFEVAGGVIVAYTMFAMLRGGRKLFAEGAPWEAWLGIFLIILTLVGMAFVVLIGLSQSQL